MNRKNLPDKEFRIGDIVYIDKECTNYLWYSEENFKVISHYLYIDRPKENTKSTMIKIELHDKNIDNYELLVGDEIVRWLVSLRSLSTGRYVRIAESLLDYNTQLSRENTIKELIENDGK